MKKVIALIIVLMFGVFALAEGIDFASYNNEQISELMEAIRVEMANRGILRSGDLYEGSHIVGKDVAPGTYSISASGQSMYYIFDTVENFDMYTRLLYTEDLMPRYVSVNEKKSVRVDLVDGQVIVVLSSPIHLEETYNNLLP